MAFAENTKHRGALSRNRRCAGCLAFALLGCSNASTPGAGGVSPGGSPGGGAAGSSSANPDSGGSAGDTLSSGGGGGLNPARGGNAGDRTQGPGAAPNGGGGSGNGGDGNGGGGISGGTGGRTVADGGGAPGGAGDAGQSGAPSFPPLTAAQIGTPVRVAGSYGLAESPTWDPCGHRLLFADVSGGGTGIIYSLGADGMPAVFMSNTGNTNGMAFDVDGSLIMTQMGARHVVRRDKSGMLQVLDPAGSLLHTPDDVTVRSDGTIYFTDGDFCPIGTVLGYGSRLPVYTIKPGSSTLVNDGVVGGPNGIELSPDERTLYVDAYGEGTVWTFSVAADGSLTKATTPFVSGLARPDSLCLDAAGNLYVAVSTGLQVIAPNGTKIKLIPITSLGSGCLVPGVTNCTFGGDDGKTLYITNWTTLYKIDGMPIPGLDWVVNTKRLKCN